MYTDRSSQYSIAAFLVVVFLTLLLVAPRFFDPTNLVDLGTSVAISAIIGIGALAVIATGNIDVSAGAVFGISGVAGASAASAGLGTGAALLVAVLTGAILGALNAVLVTVLQLPSIIATLGTSSLFAGGLIFLTSGGLWVVNLPPGFTWLGQGRLLGLSVPIFVALLVLLLAWALLSQTPAGRRIFAVGSNPEAARLAGINAKLVEGATFVINGALLALAATLTVARQGQAQTNLGTAVTITAITIAVVGGTSVFGGTGTVLGIVLAAVLVESTSSALTFLHLDPLWAQTLQGVFILAALTLSVLQRRSAGRPLRLPISILKGNRRAA
jgi:ribose/xylose/arabinose/galactoside ABC-type transport system permease subunit